MPSRFSKAGSLIERTWFPLALILLFLLAIPGVVLVVLHLRGLDREANDWLTGLGISYQLPPDIWIAQTLLVLPLLILLLYFLKLRRRPLEVPSTFLWKKSIEDLHVNSLFQWLRQNTLLLLQLLIVLFLIYAVLGMRVYANVSKGKHYILMIDNSASMSATDLDGRSRLDWAKGEALKEIDAARADDFGMVIVFNSRASTLQSYTSDKGLLRQAVNSIQPTQKPTRIEEALNLADSLANNFASAEDLASQPDSERPGQQLTFDDPRRSRGLPTEVYLYSDGRFPDLSESALAQLNSKRAGNTSALGNLRLHFASAGKSGAESVNNLGVVAFSILRVPEKKQDVDPTVLKLQALVRVANYRPQPAANVKLYLDVIVNGQPEHALQQELNLSGREVKPGDESGKGAEDNPGQQTVIFKLPPLDASADIVLHAYLPDVKDDFAADNAAWLAVGRRRKAKILLVGDKNQILEAFFLSKEVAKIAQVDRLGSADLSAPPYAQAARSGEYDLVIFDRCAPASVEDLPQANALFIDRPPPPWERGDKIYKDMPLILSGKSHPLLQQILFLENKTGVHELFAFDVETNLMAKYRDQYTKAEEKGKKPLPGLTRLIETPGDLPAVFNMARGSFTDVVLAFPLVDDKGDLMTNWPLKQSFPLFLRNVLYVLGNIQEDVRADTISVGETMVLRPEAGVKTLTITSPSGSKRTLQKGSRPDFLFGDTDELGVYTVERDDGTVRHFTVNLLDANESNIQPRDLVTIAGENIASGGQRRAPHDIWKWIVLLALGLLLVEWYVYNRRVRI